MIKKHKAKIFINIYRIQNKKIKYLNSISKISIFKSKIIESKKENNFIDLINCEDQPTKLNDHVKHKTISVKYTFRKFLDFFINNANRQPPFILNSSHMNNFNHDDFVAFLTYGDMELFYSNDIWLNDRIFMCFE